MFNNLETQPYGGTVYTGLRGSSGVREYSDRFENRLSTILSKKGTKKEPKHIKKSGTKNNQ